MSMEVARVYADDDWSREAITISLEEEIGLNEYKRYWIILSNGNNPGLQTRPETRQECEDSIEAAWGNWFTFKWL